MKQPQTAICDTCGGTGVIDARLLRLSQSLRDCFLAISKAGQTSAYQIWKQSDKSIGPSGVCNRVAKLVEIGMVRRVRKSQRGWEYSIVKR